MPWRSLSRLRSEPGPAARQAPFAGGRLLTVMMPRGCRYYRPVAVGRGYISISRDGATPNPLEWPVYSGQLGPRLGSTRPSAAAQESARPVTGAASPLRKLPDCVRKRLGLSSHSTSCPGRSAMHRLPASQPRTAMSGNFPIHKRVFQIIAVVRERDASNRSTLRSFS